MRVTRGASVRPDRLDEASAVYFYASRSADGAISAELSGLDRFGWRFSLTCEAHIVLSSCGEPWLARPVVMAAAIDTSSELWHRLTSCAPPVVTGGFEVTIGASGAAIRSRQPEHEMNVLPLTWAHVSY